MWGEIEVTSGILLGFRFATAGSSLCSSYKSEFLKKSQSAVEPLVSRLWMCPARRWGTADKMASSRNTPQNQQNTEPVHKKPHNMLVFEVLILFVLSKILLNDLCGWNMQILNNLFKALSADGGVQAFYRQENRRDRQVARSQISITKQTLADLVNYRPHPGSFLKILI